MSTTGPPPGTEPIGRLSLDKLSVDHDGNVVVNDRGLASAVHSGNLASLRGAAMEGNNGCGNNGSCLHHFDPSQLAEVTSAE